MARLALINPLLTYSTEFSIPGYETNMSGYPPLSLAYVASLARNSGHEVSIIDANILKLDMEKTLEMVKDFGADIIGFNIATPSFIPVLHYIREFKSALGLPTIVGGVLVSDCPQEIIDHSEIDYAFAGPVIKSLPEFLRRFDSGSENFEGIPGLCYLKPSGEKIISIAEEENELEQLPFPARDLLPVERYYSPFSFGKNFTPFLTYKGCNFSCIYCSLSSSIEERTIDSVMAELKEIYHENSIRDIDFYDTVFTFDRERVLDLCRKIRSENLKISWIARTRLELVDRELLEEMAAAGCRMLMYGIESLSYEVQKYFNRPQISEETTKKVIDMTAEAGISPFGFFIFGAPYEDEENIERSIEFARKSRLDFAQFSKLTPILNTSLYSDYVKASGCDYWREIVSGRIPEQRLSLTKESLSDEKIETYIKKANFKFYFSFRRALRILRRAKGFRHVFSMAKSGLVLFSDSICKTFRRGN